MRRLKTLRRPPIYPKTPGHLPCSSLTHPLPLSSRRPSVSFGGFGLNRRWAGIDISPKAVELVNMRLRQVMGSLFHHGYVTARDDIPRRTDIDAPRNYRQNKHILFGQQEGICNGCKGDFPFKLYEVDHVVPRSRGGTDHLDNLQLLCSHCNRVKGGRPQEHLIARLKEMAI